MSISSENRKIVILEQLNREGQVKVPDLSQQFAVSDETVRRDLLFLEREGLVKRVYGGAVSTKPKRPTSLEPPYLQRRKEMSKEKEWIGRAAASLVESGDTIAIDVGTTTLELAKALCNVERVTILTNSIPVANQLMDSHSSGKFTGRIFVVGGELNPEQQSMTGSMSEIMLSQFRVDKAFVSVGGLSISRGISDYDPGETGMSRKMVEAAYQTIVLADESKLDKEAFVEIAPLSRIHTIVSNAAPSKEWISVLKNQRIGWIQANNEEDKPL
ncbi:DeoR/GlpR family DNA-binding transcription regulator [Paenibacillus sp. CAU 1782]